MSKETKYVYLAGSDEDHIIFDAVYDNEADAKTYCDSRKNWKYDWVVWKAPVNGDWINWEHIYTAKKFKKEKTKL